MNSTLALHHRFTLVILVVAMAGMAFDAAPVRAASNRSADPRALELLPPSLAPKSDAARKHLDATALDSTIAAAVRDHHIPGVAAAVVKGSRVVWSTSYGLADVDRQISLTDSTSFMIASISKTFVAVALMQLVEDGLLDLDTDVNDYLPFYVVNPYHLTTPITTRMLLTHMSSIRSNNPAWLSLITWGDDSPIPVDEYLSQYLVQGGPLYRVDNFLAPLPGTQGQYSNTAYALAGYLVEAITGQTLEDYSQQNIFEPLGMTETSWFLAGLDVDDVAMPTAYQGGSFFAYGHYGYPVYPCGQLRTSLRQLARYLIMFKDGGALEGTRILESETVADMMTVQVPGFPVIPGAQWGLGWFRTDTGDAWLWGHTGGLYGVSTMMYFDPVGDYGILYLTNGDANEGHGIVANALYAFARSYTPSVSTLLSSFDAKRRSDGPAELSWSTSEQPGGVSFHVWRETPGRERMRISDTPVRDHGRARFHFVDLTPPSTAATYWLEVVRAEGSEAGTALDTRSWAGFAALAPSTLQAGVATILDNWPNPFAQETILRFEIARPARVVVDVFDVRGRRVVQLLDGWRAAGPHRPVWNGRNSASDLVAPGTYVLRLRVDERAYTTKVLRY